ncbi:uncharacterized protein Z519_07319 [Cladophialophora bantiana CBS 173.52]|uniref:Ferritin-like domain-containing protein n=1 Tax=Cladophialophora bantiana (strain ATCC 10958 / CBS 173.52 / CDC B-1940 / NIH 8579) TaxID=1442370 RepID=A0A0D2HNA3_CLAB1|nr:uncharacterized protein Z519_07319 [Cladophialophora bantiana CBS 173.52]KIW92335.1 hypothetical protein Z519_07319 [Cladophialophora bantiana CBS 173.52]
MSSFFLPVALSFLARSVLATPVPIVTGTNLPSNIAQLAGGGLPNQPGSPRVSQSGLGNFQLANFLENLESAFFQEGLINYTQWGTGGQTNGVSNMAVVSRIAAQEEVHVASIVGLLQANGAQDVAPCEYNFPTTDEKSFLALGNIITTVGIGALISLSDGLSTTDPSIEATVASIIPVESRHDAFFRLTANEIPNPTTFETKISAIWAYNLALDFIVGGSCTNLPYSITSLPVFPDLGIVGYGGPSFATPNAPGKLIFKVGQPTMLPQGWNSGQLYMAWVNQNNVPAYTPVTVDGDELHADVQPGMFGIAFAALTNQNTATNVDDLTKATLAGPLPIPLT